MNIRVLEERYYDKFCPCLTYKIYQRELASLDYVDESTII